MTKRVDEWDWFLEVERSAGKASVLARGEWLIGERGLCVMGVICAV